MSQVDFKAALGRQLRFMNRSCQSFDAGFHDEAIRIAQCIRVLIHDTKRQKSVLAHLAAKNIMLTSTCLDIASKLADPNSLGFGSRPRMFNGMGTFSIGPNGSQYFPKLGDGMFCYDLPVENWSVQTVFILDPDTWVSRKDIVLSAADRDGGAHVDSTLTPYYERLIESGDLGYFADAHGLHTPISGHHYVALRQMGHELLSSPALIALCGGQT
jgi:hypothetical protein